MADNNTLNFDLDAPAVPTLTLDPAPEAAEEKKPEPAPAVQQPEVFSVKLNENYTGGSLWIDRELPVLVCARQFIIPSPFLLRSILFPYWGDIIFLSDKQLANQV